MSWLKTVLGVSDFWLRAKARQEDELVQSAQTRTEMLASCDALLGKHLKVEAMIRVGFFEEAIRVQPDARAGVARTIEEHRKAAHAVEAFRQLLLASDAPAVSTLEMEKFRVLVEEGHRWIDRILAAVPPGLKQVFQEYDRTSADR